MLNNLSDALPFRVYAPTDEVPLYSFNGTGLGGRFVVFETGGNTPEASAGEWSNSTPGYNYSNVTNLRYENKRKVKYAPSGASKNQVFGFMLYGTAEYDNNGQKILFNPHRKDELMCVVSGESNNIITDGIVRLKASAYSGIPIPGYVAVISNAGEGKLQILNPALLDSTTGYHHTLNHVVAKVISLSGTTTDAHAGYADFQITLK